MKLIVDMDRYPGERMIKVEDPPEKGMLMLTAQSGGWHTVWTLNWEECKMPYITWMGYLPPDTGYMVSVHSSFDPVAKSVLASTRFIVE